MDKYEYKIKLDQMKEFLKEKHYEEAAQIAETINWRKVKTVSSLCLAGEVFEKSERYEEAKDAYLMAYDKSQIGRNIVFRLTMVAIKSGDFEEAEEYYEEFLEIAPNDSLRFILRYQIAKAKGAGIAELISILEEYKEVEGSERWSFELASLYHKAAMAERCVETCDELILWYGEGKYVEKALELKMLYQPLTKAQEQIYRRIRQNREGVVEVTPFDDLQSGEIVHEPIKIPTVTAQQVSFNTVNLQRELAENMKQIMEATEKSDVSDRMQSIKRLVKDIPYLSIQNEETERDDKYADIETDEEIDTSLKLDFREMLAEDHDGQISLNVPESKERELQITGQLSIEDILAEWEKTKQAAQAALEEAEKRKLESAKARALQEAGEIMDRLQTVIPQLDAGVTPQELMEDYLTSKVEDKTEAGTVSQENAGTSEVETTLQENAEVQESDDAPQESGAVPETEDLSKYAVELELDAEEIAQIQKELQEDERSSEEIPGEAEADLENGNQHEEFADEMLPEADDKEEKSASKDVMEYATKDLSALAKKAAEEKRQEAQIEEDAQDEESNQVPIEFLTDEQKEIFSYFVPVPGMEKQLCQTMSGVKSRTNSSNSAKGNVVIMGGRGTGKTVLAANLIRALQKIRGQQTKVGKISAKGLNKKDVIAVLNKMAGGYLILEKAGELKKETATKLSLAMEGATDGLVIIMEDTKAEIHSLFQENPELAKKFTEKIEIPIFTNDELVYFAKSYANELKYEIDEMAVLALYNRINGIQKMDSATTLTEVKEIVDEAIERAESNGIRNILSSVFTKRYTDEDYLILREKDFEK